MNEADERARLMKDDEIVKMSLISHQVSRGDKVKSTTVLPFKMFVMNLAIAQCYKFRRTGAFLSLSG